jgi:hypothetical protein
MKYIIDRTKWLRGEGSGASKLLRPSDGKMCCLGMVALQCGLDMRQIMDRGEPKSCSLVDPKSEALWPSWMGIDKVAVGDGYDDNHPVAAAMICNDSRQIEDHDREAQLSAIFAQHGDELTFIN